MKIAPRVQDAVLQARSWMNQRVDARWNNDPFGTKPHASREDYLGWFEQTRTVAYPQIEEIEARLGFAIDRAWLDKLAFHTQIVKKRSELGYPHGRLLYTLLREMISNRGLDFVNVLETGTARGFSALCMAKAFADAGVDGRVVTVDVLSHLRPQIWNCIDDHDGPKSRAEILARWPDLTRKILFVQGDTTYTLPRLGLDRINFAFLDAAHTESSVMHEFEIVAGRQMPGDRIVFDDVTESAFPGVVKAVSKIEQCGLYTVERLGISDTRAYAWAERVA